MNTRAALLIVLSLGLVLSACGSSSPSPSPVTKPSSGSPDAATQADLRDALTAANTAYKQTANFSLSAPPELRDFAPTLTFVAPDIDVVAGAKQVSVSNGGDNTNETVTLAALSSTGTCWYLVDVATSASETLSGSSGIHTPGTWYGHVNNASSMCTAPDSGPPKLAWNTAHF